MTTSLPKKKWPYFFLGPAAVVILAVGWFYLRATPAETEDVEPPVLRLTLLGDNGLWMRHRVPDFDQEGYRPCFREIRKSWEKTDFLIGNLEMVIGRSERMKQLRPGGVPQSPEATGVLKEEGFYAFSLANNHIMDYGVPGLHSTLTSLNEAELRFFGAGENLSQAAEPLILEKDGFRIGVLALCEIVEERRGDLYAEAESSGAAPLIAGETLRAQIRDLKKRVDFVLLFPHWGHVFDAKARKSQRQLAREMIEAGADAVVGHHPHVAQEVEIIDGRPVLYSLGNGVFHGHPKKSRKIPPERLRSVTADLQFSPAGLQRIILTPYNTNNLKTEYIPRPLSDEEASSFFRRHLKSIKGRWRQEENRAVISLQ